MRKSPIKTDICAFVWNTFLYDARVYKECRSLAEDGYRVTLICLQDGKSRLPNDETVDGFRVLRVPKGIFLFGHDILRGSLRYVTALSLLLLIGLSCLLSPVLALCLLATAVPAYFLHAPKFILNATAILRMVRAGRRCHAEVYHANDLNTLPQAIVCSGLFRRRAAVVYDSHEVQTSRTGYGAFAKILEKHLIHRPDALFCENEIRADYTAKLYGIEPPIALHNYADYYDAAELRPQRVNLHELLGIPEELPICLYQGGVQQGRGLRVLLRAVPLMDPCAVVYIGDGRIKNYLQSAVKERGLEKRVFFLPMVPRDELKYYTMDAYLGFQVLRDVCYNHHSALSNKISEYTVAGVPVIASDLPAIAHYVTEYGTGILVDSDSPESIADAVNRLLRDPKLHADLVRNSLRTAVSVNWQSEKNVLLREYHKLLLPPVRADNTDAERSVTS